MNMDKSHLLVIGGPLDSRHSLEAVAESADKIGLVGHKDTGNVDVLTFQAAMKYGKTDTRKLNRACGNNILTHDLGVMAVPEYVPFESVMIVAPREPLTVRKLGSSALGLIGNLMIGDNHLDDKEPPISVRKNWGIAAHAAARVVNSTNVKRIIEIAEYSTFNDFIKNPDYKVRHTGYFPAQNDEFNGEPDYDRIALMRYWEVIVGVIRGGNMQLLLESEKSIREIKAVMESGKSTDWGDLAAAN